MNAPKKQKPQAEKPASQASTGANAAAAPVTPEPQPLVEEPGVAVPGTLEFRPDDGPLGDVIMALSDAPLDALGAPHGNARALRRIEHDGTVYGPGEPAGDVLTLTAAQLADLEPTCAIETL